MKVYTMEEIEAVSDDEFISLMPPEYLDDPESYLRRYGMQEYTRFLDMVTCVTHCLMRLNDGSRLKYRSESVHYEPLYTINN